jgi:hypothetical protein
MQKGVLSSSGLGVGVGNPLVAITAAFLSGPKTFFTALCLSTPGEHLRVSPLVKPWMVRVACND